MTLTWDEISANAVAFSKRWEDARSERSEAQSYGPKRDLIEQSDVKVKAAEKMAKLHNVLVELGKIRQRFYRM